METLKQSESKAPPIGLRPKYIVNQARMIEISEAINRYAIANMHIPKEWIDELIELNPVLTTFSR